ncbi:hypothetical protein [Methylovirgula sp. HY1]|uniref:hypothetical protein n=1 Tax=Methylovirgula sp. HY1 TaxID=2822761 RepID=UPI001C5A6EF5|nr:hypothetical protein [Methylovirgula sp. HY1]QXX75240.1 hypothetical protein MHY1_02059 [Methylovirgula sp. HY1]
MAAQTSRWSFLFRADEGRIDAGTWWRNTGVLFAIFAVLTLVWLLVEPYAKHDLATEPLFTFPILAANLYRIFYGFASVVLLICYYNLSAKRWRDLGHPAALAGILPFFACVTAALHWLEPRVGGEIPHFVVIIADILLFLTLLWNVIDLGSLLDAFRRRN